MRLFNEQQRGLPVRYALINNCNLALRTRQITSYTSIIDTILMINKSLRFRSNYAYGVTTITNLTSFHAADTVCIAWPMHLSAPHTGTSGG